MKERTFCTYCGAELELGREYIYQYESRNFCNDEQTLDQIQQSPDYYGEPVRTCKACAASLETHEQDMRELDEAVAHDGRRFWLITMIAVAVLVACGLIFNIFSGAAQQVGPK